MPQNSDQQAKATDGSKYQRTIESTSSRMADVIQQHIALLDDRAMAYGMLADFANAKADVDEMLHLDPSSVKGYIRASDLLCLRGNQLQAIKICKDGLKKVNEDDRVILEQCCAVADAKSKQRYDILSMVPEEIVPGIIQHLTSLERLVLLNVSKTWRNRLSECSPIWSRIRIDEDGIQFVRTDVSWLACVDHHIMELELFNLDTDFCDIVLSRMINGGFKRLKTFVMEESNIEYSQSLFNAVPCVAETLQELHILVDSANCMHPAIAFKSLLSLCPGLTKFSYCHLYTVLGKTDGILEPGCMSKLTHLTLRLPYDEDEILDVEEIVRGCPKLRMLSIRYVRAISIEAIRQHCNDLETLHFNVEFVGDYTMCTDPNEPLTSGIRELALWIDEPVTFIPFFTDHARSIQILEISDNSGSNDEWEALLNACDFRHLRGFLFYARDPSTTLADVLRKTPALECLGIHDCHVMLGHLIQAISQLRYLHSLDLKYCDADTAGFHTLFRSLATKGQDSTLRKVILMENRFSLDGIIECLPDILTIQYIELSDGGRTSEQSINAFAWKLRHHPVITSIKFLGVRNVTDTTLCHLSAVKALRTLHLRDLPMITKDSLQDFNRSVNLDIEGCFDLDT